MCPVAGVPKIGTLTSCISWGSKIMRHSFLMFFASLVLASCQSDQRPAVSIDQAKQITATFEGPKFVSPPRDVQDITAVLNETSKRDQIKLAELVAVVESAPPSDPGKLTEFYLKRAFAAAALGRTPDELRDLDSAVEHMSLSKSVGEDTVYLLRGVANVHRGVYSKGVGDLGKSFELVELEARRAFRHTHLARAYSSLKHVEEARKYLEGAKRLKKAISPKWTGMFNAFLAYTEAELASAEGRLSDAESLTRRAVDGLSRFNEWPKLPFVADPGGAARRHQQAVALLADVLRRQGRVVEAEIEARKAVRLSLESDGRYSPQTAIVLQSLTQAVFDQGRYQEATILADAGIGILRGAGSTPDALTVAKSYSQRADAVAAQGLWGEAALQYEEIRLAMSQDQQAFQAVLAGNLGWALTHVRTGNLDAAFEVVTPLLERNRRILGDAHYDTAEVRGFLGAIHAKAGRWSEALSEFRDALPVLLETPSASAAETGLSNTPKEQRLIFILEAYLHLLDLAKAKAPELLDGVDPVAESFMVASRLRGRSVQRALSATAARSAISDPELAELARQEQDSNWQIAGLTATIAELAAKAELGVDEVKFYKDKIDQLRTAREVLLAEIAKRFPEYAELTNPSLTSIAAIRELLQTDESLLATYVGEERSYVWAIPKAGSVEFAVVDIDRSEMANIVQSLRKALDPKEVSTLADIPEFDVELAHRLYARLLEPVAKGWSDASSILAVKDGPLGYLPLSLLPATPPKSNGEQKLLFAKYRDVNWLARSHGVTVLPSVESLKALRSSPRTSKDRKLYAGFGDPWFNEKQARKAETTKSQGAKTQVAARGVSVRGAPVRLRAAPQTESISNADLARLPRLPDTADEVRDIARALGADILSDVFTGSDASEARIRSMDLSDRRIIAFATHGLIPGDLDGLTQPALALSSPKLAGGGGDGLLTMEEILSLDLNADWVVLSACNTGTGEGVGAEAVSGLGRAFFYAGTRALLVTNWPVETTSARNLTTTLFRFQASSPDVTRAEALRRTLLELIDGPGFVDGTGRSVFSYAHPIFWAPFSIVGDGGGAKPAS